MTKTNPSVESVATCIGFDYGSIDESINGEAHMLEDIKEQKSGNGRN